MQHSSHGRIGALMPLRCIAFPSPHVASPSSGSALSRCCTCEQRLVRSSLPVDGWMLVWEAPPPVTDRRGASGFRSRLSL